jgi:hypothetical protein
MKQNYYNVLKRALQKRDRIIEREGDADGARLTDEYLEELCEESEREYNAEVVLFGRVLT